jgi:hypothetical protein
LQSSLYSSIILFLILFERDYYSTFAGLKLNLFLGLNDPAMKQIIRISFFLFCFFSVTKSWGQLPSLSVGSNGIANGCAPHTIVFSIGSVSSNTANTTY